MTALPSPDATWLPPEAEECLAAEPQAALALGRLDGALIGLSAAAQPIIAGRVLRAILTSALRQAGHAFTDARFAAWMAGLTPL